MLNLNPDHLPKKFQLGEVACSSHSIEDLLSEIRCLLANPQLVPRTILCINSHIYNLACVDAQLREILNQSRVTAADGMAIVWAARALGYQISERCNMTDSYHAFLATKEMPPTKAIMVGCSEAEAETAAAKANQSSHCRVISTYSGYFSDSEYEEIFKSHSEIDFVFLGMGTPRTEQVTQIAAKVCRRAIVWGIGGGTIRIEAGTMVEAPAFWRRTGLQWLHRLVSDPKVLWRRYLLGNPLFVIRIAKLKMQKRR